MKKALAISILPILIFVFTLSTAFALDTGAGTLGEPLKLANIRAAAVNTASTGLTYYKVTSNTLNLRKSPSTSASVLAKLKKNDVLERLDAKNYKGGGDTWYKVKTSSGKVGYVVNSYVAKTAAPNPSRLSGLSFSKGALRPAFSPDTLQYDYYLEELADSFNISYGKSAGAAVMLQLNGSTISGDTVTFVKGAVLTVTVTAGGQQSVYQIRLLREKKNASLLQSLSFSDVTLNTAFNPETLAYSANVPYKTIETAIAYTTCDPHAQVTYYVNGEKCTDGFIPFMKDTNTIKIECLSPLGRKTTYTVVITRAGPGPGEEILMSALERRIVEQAFQLLPERHPFVLAYEEAHQRDIKSYYKVKNGHRVSGLPFEFGGTGNFKGFSSRWWNRTGVKKYPVGGMDCAEYIHWIYRNLGYNVPDSSSGLFLAGVTGVTRSIKGVKKHKVIPSLKEAKIGDVAYNSKVYAFSSGHGCHTSLFIGTARKLGIADTIRKYYKGFPVDAYLVIDIGWADGVYYHNMIKKTGTRGRNDLCGVGIQFFTSIRGNNGKYIYKSPYLTGKYNFSWYDSKTKQTYKVAPNLERNRRPYQYKWNTSQKYVMNLSRPIKRND